MAIQFELEEDEAMMLATEMLGVADGLADRCTRHKQISAELGLPPPDVSPIDARVVLMRHFGALMVELVAEARAWQTT